MPTPSPSGPTADSLFADWLARHEAGEEVDFEVLCREHPAAASELRQFHDFWARLEAAGRQHDLGGSLSEKLKSHYGSSVDPQVTLEGEEQVKGDFSSEVLFRLAGRSPATTRYRVKGEVARGGMGAVLRVWDEDLRRHLAMKVMLGKGAPKQQGDTPDVDPRTLARFLEEAQVTGQLEHPGIVPVHELGLDAEGRVYFTMKLVKGRTLKEVFDELARGEGGWTQTRVLGLILKVCEAMSYAHAKGVIHRDLKPANVMVGRFGEVYVMDWGLARILGREDDKDIRIQEQPALTTSEVRSDRRDRAEETPDSPLYTLDGDVVGTPAYMSPEQARGDMEAMGPHSDVYAVGAMLYHLLAGHMPYVPPALKANNYAVWRWVMEGAPKPLDSEAPDAPAELAAICDKAMSRGTQTRYTDMTALAADLSAYVEGRVVLAYEAGAWAEAKKWISRNKRLAAALAAAVVFLIASVVTSFIYAGQQAEATRLKDAALARERELSVPGLITDLAAFESLNNSLDYATRQDRPSYQWWPEAAHRLIEGEVDDPTRGLQWRPSLAEAESYLAKLRTHARPRTPGEIASDRERYPRANELSASIAQLHWHRRMIGLESWPSEKEVEDQLPNETLGMNAPDLNSLAWQLIMPNSPPSGREVEAVVLARRAVATAAEDERAGHRDTLAWALFRTGRFEDALAEERRAVLETDEAKRNEFENTLRELEQAIAPWRNGQIRMQLSRLSNEVTSMQQEQDHYRTWQFVRGDQEWWQNQLVQLLADLRRLQLRLEFVERSISTPDAMTQWDAAITAIKASSMYAGLQITPQIGLLPLGADPGSGLWEFAHLQSGEPAMRGPDGRLVLTPDAGLVFVLLPGGTFRIGAQKDDSSGLNYEPHASDLESPVHEVELTPFFVSKYEMTIGQWRRVASWSPPIWEGCDPLLPVSGVSWDDCLAMLARLDAWIELTTEAQWEYACRARTATPWWTGDNAESLRGQENVRLQHEETQRVKVVGLYSANQFGLYDMLGNLGEYCLDAMDEDSYARTPRKDPAVQVHLVLTLTA